MKILSFSSLAPERIDKKSGIVRGVAVCTCGPAKGHGLTVDRTTLQQLFASSQTKGDKIPVKLDHKTGISSVAGFLTGFTLDGNKLRADWHLLKHQPNAEHTWELIENLSDTCGLSCSFTGESEDGKARCRELISVDFVPHPATGNGLFSRGDFELDALNSDHPETLNEQENMTDEINTDSLNEEQLAAILHHLMDRVEELENENEQLRQELEIKGDEETADIDDEQEADAPVISERGARGGPHQYGALDVRTFDFESLIEENRRAGMDVKKSHIEALKSFSRQKFMQINLG